jgi:hypothetical protein
MLDMISPSNFLATNPEVLARTQAEHGLNLSRGWWNFVDDWQRVEVRQAIGRDCVGQSQPSPCLAPYAKDWTYRRQGGKTG